MTAIETYDYFLPPALIAQEPALQRSAARALFLERGLDSIRIGSFAELPNYLRGDECFVVNDTQVIPARIATTRASGGQVECFLLRPEPEPRVWRAWLNPARRIRAGEVLRTRGDTTIRVLDRCGSFFRVEAGDLQQVTRIGEVPLPPYIHRAAHDARLASLDSERYQTLFARRPGAVAAPTAGLHFDAALLAELARRAIPIVPVTLHVGPGTFQPMKCSVAEEHRVDPELYEISAESRSALATALADGRRIVCVGTTSLRTIETFDELTPGPALAGETNLTIRPGARFRHTAGLITNFHLPRSSLLMLVCAFHGHERTLTAYQSAIAAGFRFYSYGDAMVILPATERC
ncbi:MAG: tRNA preQ1(34) S-adenosylmethionine ribosyltransferase-isomerase QueA [Planctomycetota bacterium]